MMDSDAECHVEVLYDCFTLVSVLPEITCGVPQGSILGPLLCFLNKLPLGNQHFFPFLCCDDTVLSINPSHTSLTVDASHSHHISVLFTIEQLAAIAHCMANQWKEVTHFKITHSRHEQEWCGLCRPSCVCWEKTREEIKYNRGEEMGKSARTESIIFALRMWNCPLLLCCPGEKVPEPLQEGVLVEDPWLSGRAGSPSDPWETKDSAEGSGRSCSACFVQDLDLWAWGRIKEC